MTPNVEFSWEGTVDDPSGLAIYTLGNMTFELRLPTIQKGMQIDSMLRDVFAEGRRIGNQEMRRAINSAMDDVLDGK